MTTKTEAEQLAAELPPCADCGAAPEPIEFSGSWAVGDRHASGCRVDADLEADPGVDLLGPGGQELRDMLEQEIAAEGIEFAEELDRLLGPPASPEPPPAAE